MYSSHLEEIMELPDEERKEVKENLLRHGDQQDLILLAHIEDTEKSRDSEAHITNV